MSRVFYLFRICVISPEFVFLSVMALLTYLQPSFFIWLSSQINSTNETIKWLGLLPAGLTSVMVTQRSELLSPGSEAISKVLLSWPDYHKIESRFWLCLFFGILGSIFCLYVLLFGDIKNYIILVIFISTP
jgi:hypothetical protein